MSLPSPSTSPFTFAARWKRWRARRAFRWAVDAAVLLAAVTAIGLYQTRSLLTGVPLPALTLPRLEGGPPVDLRSYAGKPLLLAFWAPWCAVCQVESRNLSWVRELVGARAQVASVATSFRDVGEVRAYVQSHGVDYPVLLGGEDTLRAFRVQAFPTVYFVDREGRVKRSAVGYTSTLGLLARLLW